VIEVFIWIDVEAFFHRGRNRPGFKRLIGWMRVGGGR